jgi:hypothetical protein
MSAVFATCGWKFGNVCFISRNAGANRRSEAILLSTAHHGILATAKRQGCDSSRRYIRQVVVIAL